MGYNAKCIYKYEVKFMDNSNTAQYIKELRISKNLTQKELAEKLYVTDKAISKWERGLGRPDISVLPLLAEALGVTSDDIINGSDISNAKMETHIDISSSKFSSKRHVKILKLLPIVWACILGLIGVLYIISNLLVLNGSMHHYDMPHFEAFLAIITAWLVLSSVTGFIPLILCYAWHKLSQANH